MPDDTTPATVPPEDREADALDQPTPPPATVPPGTGFEAPEADVLEQSQDVTPPPASGRPRTGFEVPEADAWEQAQEVAVDDPDALR